MNDFKLILDIIDSETSMMEHHRKKEEKELVKRFEAHLKTGDNQYFDEDDFLAITNFYLESDKMKWALKACDLGL